MYSIPKSVLTRVRKLVFAFLWSGKNELVRRSNIYQPIDRGGLGLIDIELKVNSLHLKMVNYLVDSNSSLKWLNLGRYWVGRSLSKYCSDWLFLRSNLKLNSIYRPEIYEKLLGNFHKISLELLALQVSNRSARNLYLMLLKRDFQQPRCYADWYRFSNISWNSVWLSSMKGLSSGEENDVSWKILHWVLPTCVYLNSWGIPNVNIYCRICSNVPETIEHVFVECPVAKGVWLHFSDILKRLSNCNDIVNEKYIFLRCFPVAIGKHKMLLCNYLVKMILFMLWKTRCNLIYEKKIYTSQSVITTILNCFKERINICFKLKKPELNIVQIDNKFCSVREDDVLFNF